MSKFELILTDSGEVIGVGSTITVLGLGGPFAATVTELETPEPDFGGCVHYTDPDGKPRTCSGESLGAEWHYDGQPHRWDSTESDRDAFDSGHWTQEDTASMERGRDLPMRNEAGEWMP
jgi:hypothetical protein